MIVVQSSNQHLKKMKISFYLTAFCLISLSIFLVYSKFEHSNHGLEISVKENDDIYQFTAYYNAANTYRVQKYINKSIEPNGLFSSENDRFDVNTKLADKTEFYVKESPGDLKITLNKRQNTTASYLRIKNMCNGIKELLVGK